MGGASKVRRTHYISDLSLQMRYVFLNLAMLAVFFGIAVAIVYTAGWSPLLERLGQIYPQGRLVEILRMLYVRLAIGLAALVPVALLLTLLVSHTVAGPLVRVKRYLRLMARGEFDLAPLVLRRFDELKDVAQLINEVTMRMGPRFKERKKLIQSLQTTVQTLRGELARLPSVGQEVHRKVNFLADTLRILE